MPLEKSREKRLRRLLLQQGYLLFKSRIRFPRAGNWGGYRIVNRGSKAIVAGAEFDLTLEDVEQFCHVEGPEE